MAISKLLGPDGQPIIYDDLKREVGAPSMTGVRNIWNRPPVAPFITPATLSQLLLDAQQNNAWNYLVLAEEMEEREPHYYSVLSSRKNAVGGIEPNVVEGRLPGQEPGKQEKLIADAVRELLKAPHFDDAVDGMLDAIAKGYSCTEIIWDQSGKQWYPCAYKWRDGRYFRFDWDTGEEPKLIDETNLMGLPLKPFKWIVHRPKLKMGIPLRGGIARLAAVTYMCKSYGLTDWLAFAEIFGMPIRVGKYDAGATDDDITKLRSAVANIGTDAAAIMPKSMEIEFHEVANSSGSADIFKNLADWLDDQTSQAVVGQTLSSTAQGTGLGSGVADLHGDVRIDIKRKDGKQLGRALDRFLVKAFVDLNFGPQEVYPRIVFAVPSQVNTAIMKDVLPAMVDRGLKVSQQEVREKIGMRAPNDDEDLLQPGSGGSKEPGDTKPDPAIDDNGKPALNSQQPGYGNDTIDDLANEAAGDWQPIMDPFMKPLIDLVNNAADPREFQAKLPGVLHDMKAGDAVRDFAIQAFKARGLGDGTPAPV